MGTCWFWLCVLGFVATPCRGQCLNGIKINVMLLEDEDSPWSLRFVRGQIEKAIETDSSINAAEGNKIRHKNHVHACKELCNGERST